MKLTFLRDRSDHHHRDELGMRRLAAVAELGQRALATRDVAILMDQAVHLVAQTLAVDYCAVLRLLPKSSDLLFIAAVGWPDATVDHAIVPGGLQSQAGYTLLTGTSVVMEDLHTETRFQGNRLLHEQGIVSGVSVIIAGGERPFGVMSLHTRHRRRFTTEDMHFLESVANVLASAIERTQVDARLHEKELQYRAIFEATSDGLAITDLDGVIVEANPAYCAMRGYSYDQLIGLNVRDLIHPDHRHRFAEYLQTIRAGRAYQAEALLLRKDRSIFAATTDGLVIIDLNGVIVEINPAFCAMLGYSYDELIGVPYATLFHPH